MSTRRARIKAVAALPPRRKNQENADGKNKSKENVEKALKSPPQGQSNKSEDKHTPSRTIRSPPGLLPLTKTPVSDKVPSPDTLNSPNIAEARVSTPISEKVPVIISAPSVRNIFASPLIRNSPDRRRTASPLVLPSPKPTNNKHRTTPIASNVQDSKNSPDRKSNENVVDGITPLQTAVQVVKPTNSNQGTASKELLSISTLSKGKQNDIPDDYSIPSVPESVIEEAVIDGIAPLQTARHAPKPMISELKNEIISECAEVSFDPIVPLPSPSKVRPKLRPVPRLAPHRRNSIQGSASESEDESRRALLNSGAPNPVPPLRQRHDSHTSHNTVQFVANREVNRARNDSISSSVSQIPTQPPPALSPEKKEKHFSNKTRRQEMSRRSWCRRREVKRDALTMYDLIFYNPTTNPIIPDEDEINAKEANAKEEAERIAKAQESEEDADDPPTNDAAPVPQIKLGPNGEIILDEQSLVIKQSDANRKVSSVVREGAWGGGGGGGRYTRAPRTADWNAAETVRFYRALAAVGTDFTLMAQLFPDRNRKDLYLKFKKEERLNGAQVDKALRSATAWDASTLQAEFREERAEAARRKDAERETLERKKEQERERLRTLKELRIRNSRSSKALETVMTHRTKQTEMTADDFIRRALETRKYNSKKTTKRKAPLPPPTKSSRSRESSPTHAQTSGFATLTLINGDAPSQQTQPDNELATISRLESNAQPMQISMNEVAGVPSNIETGSLVVLRVNDPSSPSKTMLQTYIAHGTGKLTPVSLPPTFLNSVVGYMKKGTPKSTMSTVSSPQLTSPSSVASQDSRSCTPSVIQLNPSPGKRQRHSSYTITQL